ncbi:hypothetical protein D3C80_1388000 [compost metagenome]
MHEAPTLEVFRDMKVRQHGNACSICGHVGQNLTIIGAEGAPCRYRHARAAVREHPVLSPAFAAIGEAIVWRQLVRMLHLDKPASRCRNQNARHDADFSPYRELVRWLRRDADRQIVVIINDIHQSVGQ